MRRLFVPLLVGAVLLVAQGTLVIVQGAPSLAGSPTSSAPATGAPATGAPATGAGGAGSAVGNDTTVDPAAYRLDGSAGLAHLSSVSATRALSNVAESAAAGAAVAERPASPAYSYPVRWGTPVSGTFGEVSPSWPRGHAGIDFNGSTGDPIYAATDGRVQYAEYNSGGYGNLIMIMRKDGTQTRYAHLDTMKSVKGERVSAGDLIGTMGSTGDSSGSHLHFEVRVGVGLTPTNPSGLWTGPRPGWPAKPAAWACRNYGGC